MSRCNECPWYVRKEGLHFTMPVGLLWGRIRDGAYRMLCHMRANRGVPCQGAINMKERGTPEKLEAFYKRWED